MILGFWIGLEEERWTQMRFSTEGSIRKGPINNPITL